MKERDVMAEKGKSKGKRRDQGDLRKRLVENYRQPAAEPDPEITKLASELAGSVGKTVAKVTELGLDVVEDVGLRVMEVFSTSKKPTPGSRTLGAAATLFTRTRAKAPEVSGEVASKVTGLMVNGGFGVLRAIQETIRKTRRPG